MSDAWIRAIVALPFGLAVGSFMTVVVDRVPAGESLLRPRSHCPNCGDRDPHARQRAGGRRGCCCAAGAVTAARPSRPVYPLTRARDRRAVRRAPSLTYEDPWSWCCSWPFLALMPAVAVIDIAPSHHPEPADVPVADRASPRTWWWRGCSGRRWTSLGAGAGVRRLRRRAPPGRRHLPRDGDGRREARGADRGGPGGARPALRRRCGRRGDRCWAASAASSALLLGRARKDAIPFGPYMAAGAVVAVFVGERLASPTGPLR